MRISDGGAVTNGEGSETRTAEGATAALGLSVAADDARVDGGDDAAPATPTDEGAGLQVSLDRLELDDIDISVFSESALRCLRR